MSETTTTRRPTPAQDAAVDYEPIARDAHKYINEVTALNYERVPAAAVKAEARDLPYYSRGKIVTKQDAIDALAFAAWRASEEHKTQSQLQLAARREDEIYKSIDFTKTRYEKAREEIVADALNENKRLETVMGTVADARQAQVAYQLWAHVDLLIEQGDTPLDALKKIREETIKDLTQPWAHRATSRSTSVFANLDQDLVNEAKAEWLDWGRYI